MFDTLTLLAQSDNMGPFAFMANMMVNLVILVISWVICGITLSTIARKTGTPNEIWAWIPILNILLMLQIADLPIWYIILFFVPCVNLFVVIYTWWKICEKRGKPGPISLLMLVPCVGFVVPFYVAFSD